MSDCWRWAVLMVALVAAAGTAAAVRAADTADFSRYQVILDRSPFGSVAGSNVPEVGPGWATDYVFMGRVMMTNGQVLAVILRKSTNRPYYKAEGEMIDDVKVLHIESGPPASKLVLQRGLETAKLDYQPTGSPPLGAGAPPATGVAPGMPPPGPGFPPRTLPNRIPFRRGAQ